MNKSIQQFDRSYSILSISITLHSFCRHNYFASWYCSIHLVWTLSRFYKDMVVVPSTRLSISSILQSCFYGAFWFQFEWYSIYEDCLRHFHLNNSKRPLSWGSLFNQSIDTVLLITYFWLFRKHLPKTISRFELNRRSLYNWLNKPNTWIIVSFSRHLFYRIA